MWKQGISTVSYTHLDVYKRQEYISRTFTKETGDNFSSYLTKVRIHQAKQLLLNTDYKIYEIAIMVGYNDSQYFCRVFKKEEGISAKEYILKHGLKNKGV